MKQTWLIHNSALESFLYAATIHFDLKHGCYLTNYSHEPQSVTVCKCDSQASTLSGKQCFVYLGSWLRVLCIQHGHCPAAAWTANTSGPPLDHGVPTSCGNVRGPIVSRKMQNWCLAWWATGERIAQTVERGSTRVPCLISSTSWLRRTTLHTLLWSLVMCVENAMTGTTAQEWQAWWTVDWWILPLVRNI